MLLFLATTPAHAQADVSSVNWIISGCRSSVRADGIEPYKAGLCGGIVRALTYASSDVCAPRTANVGQMVAVVLQYIEQRPGRWHENFLIVAEDALKQTWPCR
jgi:hypothetical protein